MPVTQTFVSSGLPTAAFKNFREAQEAQDFARACRAVARIFTLTAQQLAREHEHDAPAHTQDTTPPDLTFWPRLAQRANRAACLSQAYTQHGHSTDALCTRLRRENLREFADALESGNYGELVF